MKKLIIGLSFVTLFITTSSFSNYKDTLPNWQVLKAFQQRFRNAENITWHEESELAIVRFTLNHSSVQAFFDLDGTLLGTARSILFTELPLLSTMGVNNRFENGIFYDIIEYTVNGELYYIITIETPTKKMEVKVLPTGETFIRKSKKINARPTR